jgi:hypothetical protein
VIPGLKNEKSTVRRGPEPVISIPNVNESFFIQEFSGEGLEQAFPFFSLRGERI